MADLAGLKIRTLTDFEIGARAPRKATKLTLAHALQAAGIELLEGEGVALRTA